MEKEKAKKELSAEEVAKQIEEKKINDAKKFIEQLMMMSRKERRNFAKKAKVKWNNIPKYTKEMSDKESRQIRKVTEEDALAKREMKVARKAYKKRKR